MKSNNRTFTCKECGNLGTDGHNNGRKVFCKLKCQRNFNARKFYRRNPLKYRDRRNNYRRTQRGKQIDLDYYHKNKETILIRKWTRDNIKKDNTCLLCNQNNKLQFHHISYKPNFAITVCKLHHNMIENKRCLI